MDDIYIDYHQKLESNDSASSNHVAVHCMMTGVSLFALCVWTYWSYIR